MRIGVTGASGFIGQRVVEAARRSGHTLVGYSRQPGRPVRGCVEVRSFSPPEAIDAAGLDAIVHLAGESILGYWTEEKKRRIRQSRADGTRAVVAGIAAAGGGAPGVLVSASAIGYYGDTGERVVDEASPPGEGFLADVAREWEAEAAEAEAFGLRVVLLRVGFVLGPEGGALKVLSPLFKAGLGGKLGDGGQWMSVVHVEDVARLALFAIEGHPVSGPLNAVLPEPCRNAEFTRALAARLHRPAILSAPGFALKLALGELSHLLLDSARVAPNRTLQMGYEFSFPTLGKAIQDCLPRGD